MPERGFASETWVSDEWYQKLHIFPRYLFLYLWTNDHCNQAGLYHITLDTMAHETKFKEEELPDLLLSLSPKVIWYPDDNLIWVKNFLKRQAKSSKFIAAAAKSLTAVRNQKAIAELLTYNINRYSISIPYQYYIDKISILTRDTVSVTVPDTGSGSLTGSTREKGVVKGEGISGKATPAGKSEDDESLQSAAILAEQDIIATWFSVKGFSMSPTDASELVARMRTSFPKLNILEESKRWAVRKLEQPLTRDSRPASQLWNWMFKACEIEARNPKNEEFQVEYVEESEADAETMIIWNRAMESLKFKMSKGNFRTWLKEAKCIGRQNGVFIIGVPSANHAQYLSLNQRSIVAMAIRENTGKLEDVVFKVLKAKVKS